MPVLLIKVAAKNIWAIKKVIAAITATGPG